MPEAEPLSPITFGAPMAPDPARLADLAGQAIAAGWYSNGGALHLQLEQALTLRETGADVVSLTSSGTMALMLALGLGKLPPGSEVITTPLTFAATAQAIEWNGLRPVFADVDPMTLTLCPRATLAAITPRTAAILPVHFLGVPCDVGAFADIAARHGLWLVYDAAQAFGVSHAGHPIGHYGDASAFSLHATKILHTGEGGYVVTRQAQARTLRRMRNFGLEAGRPTGPGLNGKLSELQAALGIALLPNLDAELQARAELRRRYDAELAGIPGLRLHGTRHGASDSSGYYTLRLAPHLRERLHLALAQARIFARDQFPMLCGPGTHWGRAAIITADGGTPVAPRLGPEVLCLPFHGQITGSDVGRIAGVIRRVMEREGQA